MWKDGKSSNFVWRAGGGRRTEGGGRKTNLARVTDHKENVIASSHHMNWALALLHSADTEIRIGWHDA
jgi:hypothetical protein